MKKDQASRFGKEYFKGNKNNPMSCYKHKIENISMIYKERASDILKKHLSKEAKILDVGCAYGYLLELLDKDGFDTYGIDISKYALERAKKITKAKLVWGDLNTKLPYKNNYFEAVFALDIIEHLDSPYEFLLELHRILKKQGLMFIQTPNINSIFEKFSKEKWFGYNDETHLYLFNRKSLQFLLQKSGFSVLYNQTVSAPFPRFLRSLFKNTDIGGNLWVVAEKI